MRQSGAVSTLGCSDEICHDIDNFTVDPLQVGSLQCAGLQERLAAHRDHGGGLGLQGGGGEQCGGVVTAAQPTLPDTGYRWEQARVHTSGH